MSEPNTPTDDTEVTWGRETPKLEPASEPKYKVYPEGHPKHCVLCQRRYDAKQEAVNILKAGFDRMSQSRT